MKADQKGFILLFTFILMLVLSVILGGMIFMVSYETRDIGAQKDDLNLLNFAEAGAERAMREIRDDYVTTTQTGTADLRGSDTTGSVSVTNEERMRYIDESGGNATINADTDVALLKTFDSNDTNTRIVSILLGLRADRVSGGSGATITVDYTVDGSTFSGTSLVQALTTTMTTYTVNITADRTWAWSTLMSSNFALRAVRTAGNRSINLDALYLIVTYEIDTNTEPWSTGTYQSYPISFTNGTVQSVSIVAEQGKVHLNTATQALLRYLMEENGVASATANTVATNIVNYRGASLTNPFDSIEELMQVTGMTQAIFDAIDQDVTVYSYINPYAQGPTGSRAPVNINTASQAVLEALFDPITFSSSSDITNLVDAIIAQRNTAPFTCFYSSDSSVTTDFYDFERAQSYLSNAEDDRVLGNTDASDLVPRPGGSVENALTTEFSYDTNAFYVQSLADVGGRQFRVKTILGDQGAKTFTTFAADTTSVGYRKENYE